VIWSQKLSRVKPPGATTPMPVIAVLLTVATVRPQGCACSPLLGSPAPVYVAYSVST